MSAPHAQQPIPMLFQPLQQSHLANREQAMRLLDLHQVRCQHFHVEGVGYRTIVFDLANGEILLDATAGSDAGIDVVSSEYATIAAEQTALENLAREVADRMVTRIAITLRDENQADQ